MPLSRILILDSYYEQFLHSWEFNPAATYETELQRLLEFSFGTHDAYSRNLQALGWECMDVIVNAADLQQQWAEENMSGQGRRGERILDAQIEAFKPDVIILQDLNITLPKTRALVVGQLSCRFPKPEKMKQCSVIFTSIPSHVAKIEAMGIKAVFLPLAFDPIVLERTAIYQKLEDTCMTDMEPHFTNGLRLERERIFDCVFIGGVGNPSHWRQGMQTLEAVAREIPTFKWWGYGLDLLPSNSALRRCYQGEAWGLDMYRILLQSKICLNRHGEVAQGAMNNLRNFEATGCGAMLLTEATPTVDLFDFSEVAFYNSSREAVACITDFLIHDDVRERFAKNGQRRTLRDHTYAQRMKTVSDVLTGMLCPTGSA